MLEPGSHCSAILLATAGRLALRRALVGQSALPLWMPSGARGGRGRRPRLGGLFSVCISSPCPLVLRLSGFGFGVGTRIGHQWDSEKSLWAPSPPTGAQVWREGSIPSVGATDPGWRGEVISFGTCGGGILLVCSCQIPVEPTTSARTGNADPGFCAWRPHGLGTTGPRGSLAIGCVVVSGLGLLVFLTPLPGFVLPPGPKSASLAHLFVSAVISGLSR